MYCKFSTGFHDCKKTLQVSFKGRKNYILFQTFWFEKPFPSEFKWEMQFILQSKIIYFASLHFLNKVIILAVHLHWKKEAQRHNEIHWNLLSLLAIYRNIIGTIENDWILMIILCRDSLQGIEQRAQSSFFGLRRSTDTVSLDSKNPVFPPVIPLTHAVNTLLLIPWLTLPLYSTNPIWGVCMLHLILTSFAQ